MGSSLSAGGRAERVILCAPCRGLDMELLLSVGLYRNGVVLPVPVTNSVKELRKS